MRSPAEPRAQQQMIDAQHSVAGKGVPEILPERVARGGGGHGHASNYCTICARDSHGWIARSPEARHEFMTQTGYPHGRPGYVVDHVIPLKRGGADAPWNMQWQTIAEGKAKDATE
jgi:hypothetical protein